MLLTGSRMFSACSDAHSWRIVASHLADNSVPDWPSFTPHHNQFICVHPQFKPLCV